MTVELIELGAAPVSSEQRSLRVAPNAGTAPPHRTLLGEVVDPH